MRQLVLLAVLLATPSLPAALPISEAEKAACEIVAGHLARGPRAFAERLSPASPFSELGAADALREIEARVGPREHAWWELRTPSAEFSEKGAVFRVVFPSGVDDLIILELDQQGGRWFVRDIRALSDRSVAPVAKSKPVAASLQKGPDPRLLILAGMALIFALGYAVLRRRLPGVAAMGLVAAAAIASASLFLILRPRVPNRGLQQEGRFVAMRSLLPWREAMVAGRSLPSAKPEGEAGEVVTLWAASLSAGRVPARQTLEAVASLESLSRTSLAMLINARVATGIGSHDSAAREYAALRAIAPGHDAFLAEETVVTPRTLSRQLFDASRTRDAALHYIHAFDRLAENEGAAARAAFQSGWKLQPLSRSSLIASGAMSRMLRSPHLAGLVNLQSPEDEGVVDPELARRPVLVPPGTQSLASGAFVRLTIDGGLLDLPGGAAIAPRGTAVVTARRFEKEQARLALQAVERQEPAALSTASMQRMVEAAVRVLAEQNRWEKILELTSSITPQSDSAPVSLIGARIRALVRSRRIEEARTLAAGRVVTQAMKQQPNGRFLLELSEYLAAAGAWDDSLRLVHQAGALRNARDVSDRVRRLELRRQLSTSPAVALTAHFEIHSTASVPVTVPLRIGDLLEAELARLRERFPVAEFRRVPVNVVSWDEFRKQLTGSDHILGFYDGEITIPFGNVARFREDVVSILTHELTHAVLAQSSNDAAPRWFQEGVATRMELVQRQENIFQLRSGERFMAVDLIEPALAGAMEDASVEEAYAIAQTFIRFLEDRFGPQSIQRLNELFRDGTSSDDALRAVTGKDMPALDVEFRRWGLTHAAPFIDDSPWPYARFYSLGIDPKVREAIRFSRPKGE